MIVIRNHYIVMMMKGIIKMSWSLSLNVAWKLQTCCEGVFALGGDGDMKPVLTYFGKRITKVYLVYRLMRLSWQQIIC